VLGNVKTTLADNPNTTSGSEFVFVCKPHFVDVIGRASPQAQHNSRWRVLMAIYRMALYLKLVLFMTIWYRGVL